MTTGKAAAEAEAPVVEQPPAKEESKVDDKPVKEKKLKAIKEKKPKQSKPKAAVHPPYFQMIKEALLALNDKGGSSPYAIAKYMEEKHKAVLPANFKKILGLQLKNSAARGNLMKIKASYKLIEAEKKEKRTSGKTNAPKTAKVAVKKAQEVKPATRKTRTVKKAEAGGAKKVVGAKKAKKSAAAKPKQPKSIKSPAAKRAKKAAASA